MTATSGKGRVLVVDDDADIRDGLTDLLQDAGYETDVAADGAEALLYLRSHPAPPLILLDWNMAPMNGLQFMEALAAQSAFAHVAVVILTADTRAATAAGKPGFAGHLRKPVKLDDLFSLVEKYAAMPIP